MQQNDVLQVLNKPYSQELLSSNIPARLAYTGSDGFPRVIPIAFYWDSARFIVCTVPSAPKVKSLARNPKVAITIDTNTFPPHVLLVRGRASIEVVDGIPLEYLKASKKIVGDDEYQAWEAGVRSLYKQMARISIVPEWAKLLDFESTLPSFVEELMQEQQDLAGVRGQ